MAGKRFRDTESNKNIGEFVVNNNKILIITAFILLAIAGVGLMYAYFTDVASVTAPITTGYASVILEEDDPFNAAVSAEGADTDTKIFRAISDANIDEYVRAKIVVSVEYYNTADKAWEVANIPQSDITVEAEGVDVTQSEADSVGFTNAVISNMIGGPIGNTITIGRNVIGGRHWTSNYNTI